MNEKERLEKAACEQFVKIYNQQFSSKFTIVKHQDKPDFIIGNQDEEQLGIEVSHLYHDQREAMLLLGREKGMHGLMSFNDLLDALNRLLQKKFDEAQKYPYKGDKHLVVRTTSPIWGNKDFKGSREKILVPSLSAFEKVWLIFNLNRDEMLELK